MSKLSKEQKEEIEKCKNSPSYFYNKYVRRDGDRFISDEDFESFLKMSANPLKYRQKYK